MRKILPIILALFLALPVSAKLTQFIVRGYVVKQDYSKADWYRESLDSVFVALVKNDTIPVDFKMLSGNDDLKQTTSSEFRILAQGGVGSYSLILNRDGYEPLRHDFKVVSEGQDIVYLRSLAMEPRRDNTLDEVEVVGTAIKMVMKGDTIVYDSRAFKLAEGSSLDALIRQLPGAQLAEDGSITVNGKKVTSLLLDGNDFFQGDPEVALKNLPAYTVDKIKVYDKAAKDDYITLDSQSLSSSPDNENIVMDVVLKKEFAMATILSVEGGYGPGIYPKEAPKRFDNRYLGRAFVIGFGKNYRWSAYGGYNNINNTSKASSQNKDWGENWGSYGSGDGTTAIGGLDVFYNPTKKWEITAYMSYERQDMDSEEKSSETYFYDTGNLYQRNASTSNRLSENIRTYASVRYSGDKVSLYVSPGLNWSKNRIAGFGYQATFDRNPFESFRGAALDSIFSGRASQSLLDAVTTSAYRSSKADPSSNGLMFSINVNATWRPTKGRGLFRFSASGSDRHGSTMNGALMDQPFIADPNVQPIRLQKWDDKKSRYGNFGANLCYEWDKKIIGEKWINTFNMQPALGWDVDRSFNDNIMTAQLLLDEIDISSNPLPSVTAPENIRPLISFDGNNSVKNLDLKNDILSRFYTGFSMEPTAPTDSGINPSFGVNLRYFHRQYWRHYTYDKPYADPEFHHVINSCDPVDNMSAGIYFNSRNKIRFIALDLSYGYESSLRSLSALIPTMNNSDPLNIYYGPAEGEKFPVPYTHNLRLYFNYHNQKNHQGAWFYVNYDKRENLLSHSTVFNPATGVTVHRPMTINGNWNLYSRANYDIPFGPNDCWGINPLAYYSHNNSVDYISSVGTPERSLVKTDEIGGGLYLRYKLKNGTTFSFGGDMEWQHSASPRVDFRTITAWDNKLIGNISFFLPWQLEGETRIIGRFRRGYEDSSMNRTEWVWNASIQKTVLKGAMTVKLNAVDILGQLSNIHQFVNAQGRMESWNNSLPRYVMLTVAYRFNFTPKALQ